MIIMVMKINRKCFRCDLSEKSQYVTPLKKIDFSVFYSQSRDWEVLALFFLRAMAVVF